MAEGATKADAKLDRLMQSVDLLFSKIEDLHITQQQMQVKLDVNSKAVDLSMREQQVLAQQLEATGQAVAKLTVDQLRKDDQDNEYSPPPSTNTAHRQNHYQQDHSAFGEPHYHRAATSGHPFGHNVAAHRNSLPKM